MQGPPTQAGPVSTTTVAAATAATTAASAPSSAAGAAPSRYVHVPAFQTPTGNIGCMIVPVLARCDIVRRAWQLPPRPSTCPQIVDFGQGLEIGSSGAGRLVCAGDTVREPTSPRLAYRTATQIGSFVCVSRATGVTCTNSATAHGFTLSIQSYQLF